MAYVDLRNRAPKVERLPDTRLRVTRVYDVLNFVTFKPADLITKVWLAWGTQDVLYTNLRLIKQDITGQLDGPIDNPEKRPTQLVRVYEEIPESAEVQVGNNEVIRLKDGRIGIKAQFLQFSSATATPGTVNVTTAPGVATAFMLSEDAPNDGTLRRIERIYETAGVIAQTDETKNNGALLLRTITSVHTAPDTPAGYVLYATRITEINGFPTFIYSFAKGLGQVSILTEYEHSPDQGTTGVTVTTIRHLTGPAVAVNPTAGPVGSQLIKVGFEEADAHRIWTAVYASGQGIVESDINLNQNGKLVVYSITSINAAPSTPAPMIGGTVVLIDSNVENGMQTQNGVVVYRYKWAEGYGQVSESISSRLDGLREVTWVSLGVRLVPPNGIVRLDEWREAEGHRIYTVSAMQAADGTDPLAATRTFQRQEDWTYPGRAKSYETAVGYGYLGYALDVYLSPPVQTKVEATVEITYQLTDALGALANPYWAPTGWASLRADWMNTDNLPGYQIRALHGYRSISDTPIVRTVGYLGTYYGILVMGNNTYLQTFGQPNYDVTVVTVGGPAAPDGNTYTLDAFVEPAFADVDGTVYYRKTVIYATIPAQDALPV